MQLELLEALASLDAPSGDPEKLAATANLLVDQLNQVGARVETWPTPSGSHIEAQLGPDGERPILILGHYDTVWPRGTAEARPLHVDGDVVRGPGVFDMRGGLTAVLVGVRCLLELGLLNRPLRLFLSADEESGSGTSQSLIEERGRGTAATLIPEPPLPRGRLKTSRRGLLTYRIEAHGREAHAGLDYDRGINAITELTACLKSAEDILHPLAGAQLNVGVIGGGIRSNVIPGTAFAELDIRVTTQKEADRIQSGLAELSLRPIHPEARLEISLVHQRPPMERTPAIAKVVAAARELAQEIGLELNEGAAGGGSDGNFLAPLGVPVLDGLGPEGDGAHALHEHIRLSSLEARACLIALLVMYL